MNKLEVMGRLTKDPLVKESAKGTTYSLVDIHESFKNKKTDAWEYTNWNGVYFDDLTDMKKGDPVIANGYIKDETYEKDGQKRYVKKFYISEIVPKGNEDVKSDEVISQDNLDF